MTLLLHVLLILCDTVCSSCFFCVKWFLYVYIYICCRATGFNLIKLAKPPSKYISLFSGEANVHLYGGPLLSNTFTLTFFMLLSASGYETEWSPTVTGFKVGIFVCLLCWVMGLVPMFVACDDWILPEAP